MGTVNISFANKPLYLLLKRKESVGHLLCCPYDLRMLFFGICGIRTPVLLQQPDATNFATHLLSAKTEKKKIVDAEFLHQYSTYMGKRIATKGSNVSIVRWRQPFYAYIGEMIRQYLIIME